jgi:hypothetical protein
MTKNEFLVPRARHENGQGQMEVKDSWPSHHEQAEQGKEQFLAS